MREVQRDEGDHGRGDDGDRNRVVAVEDRRGDEDHQEKTVMAIEASATCLAASQREDDNHKQDRQPHQRRLPIKVGIEVGVGWLEPENDHVAGIEVGMPLWNSV